MAGVSLGARIVEKHLTLSRNAEGPDSDFALGPGEFAKMVQAVRKTGKALGEARYETTEKESESETFRRSPFVVEDVEEGEISRNRMYRAFDRATDCIPVILTRSYVDAPRRR